MWTVRRRYHTLAKIKIRESRPLACLPRAKISPAEKGESDKGGREKKGLLCRMFRSKKKGKGGSSSSHDN